MSQVPGLGHVTFYRQPGRYPTLFHYTAEEAQSIQVLVPQTESKTIPPKVQEGIDHHWNDA
jgi:hypothetical protein